MNVLPGRKIVLLGMMTKMPVAGNVWLVAQYLEGFRRLGYDPYYVEAHARTPSMLMQREDDDSSALAAGFIADVMHRFGFSHRWAFHALHDDGRCYGMSESQLRALYRSATLLVNLHGGTVPLPEHSATGRLVYLNTDPVEVEVEVHQGVQQAIDFLEPHCAFFTWGTNHGNPDCRVPVSERFHFVPTLPPVLLDLWEDRGPGERSAFTTIGNWRQLWRSIRFQGETYHWSKHHEFLKFLDLPKRTPQPFELALSSFTDADQQLLETNGWRVRRSLEISSDVDAYRGYIAASRGEFTVAKDQNVRLRSGWFSERSAQYLASGRPVITQETGFSNFLPTGEGLFGFSTMEEILQAVDAVNTDYPRHCRAARDVAREHFEAGVVLGAMLERIGLPRTLRRSRVHSGAARLATGMDLTVVSRRPVRLHSDTVAAVLALSPADEVVPEGDEAPEVSIVVISYQNLVFTKLCLESVLGNTDAPTYELIVVDNASRDGSPEYLRSLAEHQPHVRVLLNEENVGFARANNQGLARARGRVLVLLNNDTVVPPGWLAGLAAHLEDPTVGLVGPVTNRIGNEAQIETEYRTYGEMLEFAGRRARLHRGERFDIRTLTMFCLAMRRGTFDRLGPLDERFEVGMLEDDDYSMRASAAGLRVVCAEDVFVHHFGEASFGKLVPTGEYGRLLAANKRRFREKWGREWEPYGRNPGAEYRRMSRRIRELVHSTLPRDAVVAVVSRGDEELLRLQSRRGWHFPQNGDGVYAGFYPADSMEAIAQLETVRVRGAGYLLVPSTSLWWLQHYPGLREHLERSSHVVAREEETCVIFRL